MISRRTTRILAEIFHYMFAGSDNFHTSEGLKKYYRLKNDALYDFLYEHDYDAWFLNAAKSLFYGNRRALKEFIMRLHTGETAAQATPDWSWQQRIKLSQRLLRDLSEDVLIWANTSGSYIGKLVGKYLPKLRSQLELDGYIFRDGKLYYTEASILDTEGEEGILEKLIKELNLNNQEVMMHHLELSETHYIDEKWDDSIANSRKFLESVLQEVASKYHMHRIGQPIVPSTYSHPSQVRDYLESQRLIEPKEKDAISKVYSLLSETGSHPYIAERDQTRLMRYLSLTFAQFALLRLKGSLKKS